MKCCQKLIENKKSKCIVLAINISEEQVFFEIVKKERMLITMMIAILL